MSRPWRLPALILLPVLLVIGVVAQTDRDDTMSDGVRLAEMTPTASAAGTLSSTWYCAAGSATRVATGEGAGPAEHVVIVSNASDQPATARVTVFAGVAEGSTDEPPEPELAEVAIGAHERRLVRLTEVLDAPAPWAAALVEVTGGEVTVAHELSGPDGRSISDCASSPSSNWYFPGGTTLSGARLWVALFNPFPGEATVDVAFDTTDGARVPPRLQGIVVPSRSVVVREISAGGVASEQLDVATTVSVRSGRIVAEIVQSDNGREDMGLPKGLTATIGATMASPTWMFPSTAPTTDPEDTSVERVWVFNPGDTDTTVRVQVQLNDPSITVEPFEVSVAAHRMTAIPVRDPFAENPESRVPAGMPHWLIVQSTDGADIVAQRMLTGPEHKGVSYAIGIPVVASRWLLPVAGAADENGSVVTVANPSPTDTATVTLRRHEGGQATDVPDATVQIAPGEMQLLDLFAAGITGDAGSVEVVSDIPVVVGQWLSFSSPTTPDLATPLGIPVVGTQSLPLDLIGPGVLDDGTVTPAPDGATDPSAPESTTTAPESTTTTAAPGTSTTTAAPSSTSSSTTTTAAGT